MRWLLLILGLAAALIAGFSLLTGPREPSLEKGGATPETTHVDETHDDIDEESRERLREILRQADREQESGR